MWKKPVKGEDLVLKWSEFLAEFKHLSNLDLAAKHLTFVQYYWCVDERRKLFGAGTAYVMNGESLVNQENRLQVTCK